MTQTNAANSQRDAMQRFWEMAGLQSIETRVIRIPVVYPSFDDFWSSNTAPIGPQGKVIAELSPDAKEQGCAITYANGCRLPRMDGSLTKHSPTP